MRILLDEGASLNAADMENETALHGAVFGGHIDAVQFLLKRGIRTDIVGVESGTAYNMAKQMGQESIARLINGEDPDSRPPPSRLPSDTNPSAPSPLNVNTNPQVQLDPKLETVVSQLLAMWLVNSAAEGNLDDVTTLLDGGVSVDETWEDYGTALHAASFHGHLEVAQLLLERGASANVEAGKLGYPLHAACIGGHFHIMNLLVVWGADINAEGGVLGFALQAAARGGHLAIMHALVLLGANINAFGGHFSTALIAAATQGLLPCHYLVSKGAIVTIKAREGWSVVDVARSNGHDDAVAYLKSCGAKSSRFFSMAGFASRVASFCLSIEAAQVAQAARVESEADNIVNRMAEQLQTKTTIS